MSYRATIKSRGCYVFYCFKDYPAVKEIADAFYADYPDRPIDEVEVKAESPMGLTDEFQEYEQRPNMSDSDMQEIIKDYIALGWSLSGYTEKKIKIWCFQKG